MSVRFRPPAPPIKTGSYGASVAPCFVPEFRPCRRGVDERADSGCSFLSSHHCRDVIEVRIRKGTSAVGCIRVGSGQHRMFEAKGDGLEPVGLFGSLGEAKTWSGRVWVRRWLPPCDRHRLVICNGMPQPLQFSPTKRLPPTLSPLLLGASLGVGTCQDLSPPLNPAPCSSSAATLWGWPATAGSAAKLEGRLTHFNRAGQAWYRLFFARVLGLDHCITFPALDPRSSPGTLPVSAGDGALPSA